MGQVRKHVLLLSLCHLILRKVLQAVINACKIRRFGGLFWFCLLGFALVLIFFTVKQRKWGDKGIISVRILLCARDTALSVQLRGSKDWGLQFIIFLIGSHEEMGSDYPSKCPMFYEAFTAPHILTVFYCHFTNSDFKIINADYNCYLDWKKYPT